MGAQLLLDNHLLKEEMTVTVSKVKNQTQKCSCANSVSLEFSKQVSQMSSKQVKLFPPCALATVKSLTLTPEVRFVLMMSYTYFLSVLRRFKEAIGGGRYLREAGVYFYAGSLK